MISPKLAILMATMAVVGAGALPIAPMALADDPRDGDDSQSVEIERNNEIEQSIDQEQEACTNEAEAEIDDGDLVDIVGDNEAEADQFNFCDVDQTQTGTNAGAIEDLSFNDFELESILANVGLDL